MQGLAVANDPVGPFVKCPLNPVVNSGHETAFFPWKEGIAAIVTRDGPEKNTIQFAPDGVNFEVMSMVEFPPIAAGPFVPDVSADNGGGKGITWGLCHIIPDGSGATNDSMLVRFDCHLSPEGKRAEFLQNCLPLGEVTYFQPWFALPGRLRQQHQ